MSAALRSLPADLADARRARSVSALRPGSPPAILAAARVDLIALIGEGMPERSWVRGADGLIPQAKRLHIAAPAKSGKSLAIGTITALEIIAAGGSVAVLDRENGPDEYARRLEAVLDARAADDVLRVAVSERLHYCAWPVLSLAWAGDPAWPEALAGIDVVIFDGTRTHTAPLGLNEDSSDDFSRFTSSLIDPLARAGIATVLLDNTGLEDKHRPRGTTSKVDLCDLALSLKASKPFSSKRAGEIMLTCERSRIDEIAQGDSWRMRIGAGTYGGWECNARNTSSSSGPRPEERMREISAVIEQSPGISSKGIREAVPGGNSGIDYALKLLIEEGSVRTVPGSRGELQHHLIEPDLAHFARPCQTDSQARSEGTLPTVPTPVGGSTMAGTVRGHAENGDRARALDGMSDAELQLLIDSDALAAEERGA
jgi:hypothetical protein